MPERPDTEFLPLADAAERYRIGKSTLRRLADEGRLTRHRREADKRLWLRVAELERVLRPQPGKGEAPRGPEQPDAPSQPER